MKKLLAVSLLTLSLSSFQSSKTECMEPVRPNSVLDKVIAGNYEGCEESCLLTAWTLAVLYACIKYDNKTKCPKARAPKQD